MVRAISAALFVPFVLSAASPALELVSVERIWNQAPHSAFGDIIRFHDRWFCVFREGGGHVPKTGGADDGKLRVITSADGKTWSAAALIAEDGIDLRDPHLSITASGQLMIVAGGSEYPGGVYKGRQPRVAFSRDGRKWTKPRTMLERGHWLWRVTWRDGVAWGVSKYGSPAKELPEDPRKADLVRSKDGVHWERVLRFDVPGADETALRFDAKGRMIALMRTRSLTDEMVQVGWSDPPYTSWHWTKQDVHVGGPNFIVLPGGDMIAGGRWMNAPGAKTARTGIGPMTLTKYTPQLALPSDGDNSYPGFVFHDGLLWTMYYSSHEGNTAIYLAKIRIGK
jgi:hypothetical protein